MSNYWKISGVPHRGWTLEYVYDVREEGQPADECQYETCMMCNNEKIRFVHVVHHQDYKEPLKVGCVCAEKMTNDYINPKKHERSLRNKVQRRLNWLRKEWKISKNGNLFLNINDHHILIYKDKKTNKFKCKIGEQFGKKQFETVELAKIAAFNGIEYYKEKKDW